MIGFVSGLEGFEIRHINAAFKEWLQLHGEMPTPADIRHIADEKAYLEMRRNAPKAKTVENVALPPPVRDQVSWAFMVYTQIQENGLMPALKEHIANMPDNKRDDYIKYLRSLCEFPSGWTP